MSKHYLYLTNDRIIALLIKGNTIVERENFALTDVGTAAFGAYLEAHRRQPTWVITDLIEEDFRLDTIPHLRGSDQDAVIERKLSQIYRASPYRNAIIQGREEEGRRDDRVFMHAVTNADLLKPIIAVLAEYGIPLEGVHSSAVLSSLLLKEFDIFFPHTMLVTIVPDFGLRQTYFKDKQVKFSRLTPILYEESRSVGQLIAAETSRTWQYLDSLRYFSEDDSLEVCILVHERDRVMLQDAIRTFPLLKYRFIDVSEVATKLKLSPAPTSSHAEEVLCHIYSRNRLDNHFAALEDTRHAVFRRTRIGLILTTAIVLAVSVAVTGFNFMHANKISDEIDARSQREKVAQIEFQAIIDSMRKQKMATDTVRDASTFFNTQLRPAPASPGAMMKDVALVLNEYPAVTLNQIAWISSNDSNAPLTVPAAITTASLPATSSAPAAAQGTLAAVVEAASTTNAAAPSDPNPPLPGNKFQIAVLDLAITPFDGNVRKLLEDIERFRARMAQLPDYTASVTALPINTSTTMNLNVIDRSKATAKSAPFTLRLVKKYPTHSLKFEANK